MRGVNFDVKVAEYMGPFQCEMSDQPHSLISEFVKFVDSPGPRLALTARIYRYSAV